MIPAETTEIVRQSYGRCISTGHFIKDFYDTLLTYGPRVREKFVTTDMEEQYHRLKHGLNLMIMFAGDSPAGQRGLGRIQDTHRKTKMNIEPDLYESWKKALITTVASHDREHTAAVSKAWDQVLEYGIQFIAAGYEA